MINEKTIKHIAELAKLNISEKDIPKLSKELSEIMDYAKTLNDLDLEDIEPTAHAVKVQNVFREDLTKDNNVFENIIKQAPEHDGCFFRVPKVL